MNTKLELKNLTVSYGGKPVAENLNGSFASGRLNLLVGRAGSGKSSLLLTIAGFHLEHSGQIIYDGAIFQPAGNFSLTFQNPESLFFNTSVGDEVEYSLRMRELPENEITPRAQQWLQRWGLDPEKFYQRHPFELSGGEKRRVALAACTVAMPPVILLDEPLAGLDANGQKALAEMLNQLALEHIVIVVTHEPEVFLQPDSSILFLREGQGSWFSGDDFLRQAVHDRDFYPLPRWYCQALAPFAAVPSLPPVNAEAVASFITREKNHADQL